MVKLAKQIPQLPAAEEPLTVLSEWATAENIEAASKVKCKCKTKVTKIAFGHEKECPVNRFEPWSKVECEWVPHLEKIVFYSHRKGAKVLIGEDGEEIPKVGCYCKPEKVMYCGVCKVERNKFSDPWREVSANTTYKSTYVQKDRHYGEKLTFPDGTVIWASSQHSRKKGDPIPDFAMYMANSWHPECAAYMLSWADYGLPEIDWNVAIWMIEQTFEAAKHMNVEVGCIGGHGRTGTVLACMAVLAGVKPANAVKWVRKNYCQHAIESPKQEWWVRWFDCTRRGVKPPPMPVPAPVKTTTKTTGGGSSTAGTSVTGGQTCNAPTCNRYTYNQPPYCYEHIADKGEPDSNTTKAQNLTTKAVEKGEDAIRKIGEWLETGKDPQRTLDEMFDEPDAADAFKANRECATPGCHQVFCNTLEVLCFTCREKKEKDWRGDLDDDVAFAVDQVLQHRISEIEDISEIDGVIEIPNCAVCGQETRVIGDETVECETPNCPVDGGEWVEEVGSWIFFDIQDEAIAASRRDIMVKTPPEYTPPAMEDLERVMEHAGR